MLVTICNKRPSNDPEIHLAGCADITRNIQRGRYEDSTYDIEVTSRVEVSASYWSDILEENDDDAADYVQYFKFLPCTKGLA